jgi:hypothetical protein
MKSAFAGYFRMSRSSRRSKGRLDFDSAPPPSRGRWSRLRIRITKSASAPPPAGGESTRRSRAPTPTRETRGRPPGSGAAPSAAPVCRTIDSVADRAAPRVAARQQHCCIAPPMGGRPDHPCRGEGVRYSSSGDRSRSTRTSLFWRHKSRQTLMRRFRFNGIQLTCVSTVAEKRRVPRVSDFGSN